MTILFKSVESAETFVGRLQENMHWIIEGLKEVVDVKGDKMIELTYRKATLREFQLARLARNLSSHELQRSSLRHRV